MNTAASIISLILLNLITFLAVSDITRSEQRFNDYKKLTGHLLFALKFFISWILMPLLHKVVFIFTPMLYRYQVEIELEDSIYKKYSGKIKDLKIQLNIVGEERSRLQKEFRNKSLDIDSIYQKGIQYGFYLREKKKGNKTITAPPQLETSTHSNPLTISQLHTLRQISKAKGCNSNDLSAAFLEDNEYITLVWNGSSDDYEITIKGNRYLNKHKYDLPSRYDDDLV